MACMCGDTHCWSCGPAQGNFKCPICRAWADDGCEHYEAFCGVCGQAIVIVEGDETCPTHDDAYLDMRLKPEFAVQAEELARQEAEAEERLARELEANEHWKNQD